MTDLEVGARVVVDVPAQNVAGWSAGALVGLQCRAGTIERIKPLDEWECKSAAPATHKVLVTFDEPAPPSWPGSNERQGHWFNSDEVRPA